VVEIVFGHLFEPFRLTSQAARTRTSAGADTQSSKKISGVVNEEDARAMVCNDLDLYFIVCKFNLYSDDASIYRKPSATKPLKKTIKPATASQIVPPVIAA
jgi:hypothetical protein